MYATKKKPKITAAINFPVGIKFNNNATPTTGNILDAIVNPPVNHAGIAFNTALTISPPTKTAIDIGIAAVKNIRTGPQEEFYTLQKIFYDWLKFEHDER